MPADNCLSSFTRLLTFKNVSWYKICPFDAQSSISTSLNFEGKRMVKSPSEGFGNTEYRFELSSVVFVNVNTWQRLVSTHLPLVISTAYSPLAVAKYEPSTSPEIRAKL